MNFLFATVLVLLLVAPGLCFFKAYNSGVFSIRYSRLTITDQIFRSIVPGITVQVIAILLINKFSQYNVRLDVLGTLLLGAKEDATIKDCFMVVSGSLWQVTTYHLLMVSLGGLLGWTSRIIVRKAKLDRRLTWLRFDNKWFYWLSGEFAEFREGRQFVGFTDAKLIQFSVVDILVAVEDGNIIYTGFLVDYELENDGGLKNVQIAGVKRKQLRTKLPTDEPITAADGVEQKAGSADEYLDVAGDIMIIPFGQIMNLNITYWLDQQQAGNSEDVIQSEAIIIGGTDPEQS